ncbi:MAG: zinc-ribbon domain-containing protein [Clostridia bacterium]|nr:zinc-ribbon domain-containing protein [Clostridia bacterium]
MFCNNCGKVLDDNASFCTACGSVVERPVDTIEKVNSAKTPENIQSSESKPNKKKRSINKAAIIIIAVAVIVIGAVITITCVYVNNTYPSQQLIEALENKNFDEALDIYNENYDGDENKTLIKALEKHIAEIKQSFTEKTAEYEIVKLELETISEMEIESLEDLVQETTEYVSKVNSSRSAFNSAETFFAAANYSEAISQYKLMAEADPDYEKGKSRLAEAINLYRDSIVAEADKLSSQSDYTGAIKVVNEALGVISDDVTLKEKITLLESQYVNSVIAKADEYVKADDYVRASAIINEALETLPQNETLLKKIDSIEGQEADFEKSKIISTARSYADKKDYLNAMKEIKAYYDKHTEDGEMKALYENYSDKYVQSVISSADGLVAEKKYTDAIKALEAAIQVLPGNTSLTDKLAYVNDKKPLSIAELTPINENSEDMTGFEWSDGIPLDPFGNDYSTSENFVIVKDESSWWRSNSYCEYRIYKKYSTIQGFVCPYKDMPEDGNATFQIIADDKIIYSTQVTRKMDPVEFSVDVSVVDYIKFNVMEEECYSASIILGDVLLYSK